MTNLLSRIYDYANGVITADVDNASTKTDALEADKLSTVYDHRITSASDLESLNNILSTGDTVVIEQPSTPYRVSSWVDIDVDHVSVEFKSPFAKDGQAIVKVADGANVGGLRVGYNSTTSDVTIKNYGHNGNKNNQDQTTKRLHGITVHDGVGVEVINGYITRTSPYHEHNSGGSGASIRQNGKDVVLEGIHFHDVGDRCVQGAGDDVVVKECKMTEGYDRAVSTNVQEPDGNYYTGRNWTIKNNYVFDLSDGGGSAFALQSGDYLTDRGYHTVEGNHVVGAHDSMVKVGQVQFASNPNTIHNCTITGNIGNNTGELSGAHGIQIGNEVEGLTISSCVLKGYSENGLYFSARVSDINTSISDVVIRDVGNDGIRQEEGNNISVSGVVIDNPANYGVYFNGKHNSLSGVHVTDSGGDAIHAIGSDFSMSGIVVRGAGDRGVYSEAGATTWSDLQISDVQNEGVVLQDVNHPQRLENTDIEDVNQASSSSAHLHVYDSNTVISGVTTYGNGLGVIEDSGAADNKFSDMDLTGASVSNPDLNGSRTRWNNTIYISGAPTDSDYRHDDRGTIIRDTTNNESYIILPDSTTTTL